MMYKALIVGLVTRVIPIIGALVPIMLLLYGAYTGAITSIQMIAVVILIFGILFLTLFEWKGKIHPKELPYEIISALLFAIAYTFLRFAYLQDNFLTVFIWSRIILIPLAIVILLLPKTRTIVLGTARQQFKLRSQSGLIFLVGQAAGGMSELLLIFSVYLANPALVNSLQGSQYIFLFIASIFLARRFPHIFAERHQRWAVISKVCGIICVVIGLYIMAFANGS